MRGGDILGRMTAEPLPAEFATDTSTWQHLDDLVDEIAGLVRSDLVPREFWRRLLDRTVRALAAVGGSVWLRSADGRLALACQIEPDHAPQSGGSEICRQHERLLAHVAETKLALSLPPRSTSSGNSEVDNPTPLLLLLSPVVSDEQTRAIIEIFQRPSDTPTAPEGYLRFLTAVCELAADYDRQRQLAELRQRAGSRIQFEDFTRAIHGTLDTRRVAYTIANDGRSLIGCDRVSVAMMRGRRARLASVSGVETVNARASTTRKLERLIKAVVTIDAPLSYPDEAGTLPPQIEEAVQTYVDESHARQLFVIPLHAPVEPDGKQQEPVVIGALVCEYFTPSLENAATEPLIDAVAAQSELALANALQYESVPLARLWRSVSHARWLVHGRTLPKTLLVASAIAAAVAALVLVKIDFTVAARGELLPEQRRDVFAPVDGMIAEIRVAHGDTVAKGQTLLVLRQPQLELERARVTGEMQTARKGLAARQASRFGGAAASAEARDQYHQRSAEEEEVKEALKGLAEQVAALDRQQTQLTVQSPIAGQVLTWDVAQLLESRPVQRGHLLMSVGDAEGPWELEMRVDDDRIGHVLDAQREASEPLDVSYLLAMSPDHSYAATVREIAMTTDVIDNSGPQVLVTASLDRDSLPRLRPGASVVAKIHCGQRSVGYVWLHDLWDAVCTRVLF
jgi:multidrug efflux pump subunit AcrA (membrane-fusion protein)